MGDGRRERGDDVPLGCCKDICLLAGWMFCFSGASIVSSATTQFRISGVVRRCQEHISVYLIPHSAPRYRSRVVRRKPGRLRDMHMALRILDSGRYRAYGCQAFRSPKEAVRPWIFFSFLRVLLLRWKLYLQTPCRPCPGLNWPELA